MKPCKHGRSAGVSDQSRDTRKGCSTPVPTTAARGHPTRCQLLHTSRHALTWCARWRVVPSTPQSEPPCQCCSERTSLAPRWCLTSQPAQARASTHIASRRNHRRVRAGVHHVAQPHQASHLLKPQARRSLPNHLHKPIIHLWAVGSHDAAHTGDSRGSTSARHAVA